ncbi:MAG TPA: ADP-ribosylglycohydrolase family protein [Streptosporangiaceae bacterium]
MTAGEIAGGMAVRARGALFGLAIGDALGMPTESLPRAEIVRRYGTVVDGFHAGPADQPVAPGLPAGTVTDDTEQAVMLGRLLVENHGVLEPQAIATALLDWEQSMRARGWLALIGPSTRRALDAILAGEDVSRTGSTGTTNGAAMRIAPIGVATPADSQDLLISRVVAASMVTHHTGVALAGAAAVAAAVAAGVGGATVSEALSAGASTAAVAAGLGYWVAAADVGERIRWAASLTASAADGGLAGLAGSTLSLGNGEAADRVLDLVYRLVGTSLASQESVPAAFAIAAACPDDAWTGCRLAASVGGDCDTIAAMTGAILGACLGEDAFPAAARRLVSEVNDIDLPGLAAGLLAVRERGDSGGHGGGPPASP